MTKIQNPKLITDLQTNIEKWIEQHGADQLLRLKPRELTALWYQSNYGHWSNTGEKVEISPIYSSPRIQQKKAKTQLSQAAQLQQLRSMQNLVLVTYPLQKVTSTRLYDRSLHAWAKEESKRIFPAVPALVKLEFTQTFRMHLHLICPNRGQQLPSKAHVETIESEQDLLRILAYLQKNSDPFANRDLKNEKGMILRVAKRDSDKALQRYLVAKITAFQMGIKKLPAKTWWLKAV
ncbi:hypothetical protein [Deinococcus roseus]|uniref:Uncharacterized protein n=1 Tax=Deinococcus roseus TaxID=392414 RepID=A0ABQ2DM76_9DEIO|nr:hypothetical protein [Deinococcus roseus]GGJ59965.1 hypothetical protein GCM10008938_52600 [Deinococcus roseus]